MNPLDALFYIIILIMSVVIHEVSHGYAAYKQGDMTAYDQDRLTLNPLKHLELFGSIILPALLILTHAGFVFGWAKPVPYNPNNLRNRKWGTIAVASAGIIANLSLVLIFSIGIRLIVGYGIVQSGILSIFGLIVFVNLLLAVFNFMPIPPLDGSKILFALLGRRFAKYEHVFEQYSLVFFVLFIFFLWQYISPIITWLFIKFTGSAI